MAGSVCTCGTPNPGFACVAERHRDHDFQSLVAQLAATRTRADQAERERDELRAQKDGAYRERDQCVAALARAANQLGGAVRMGRHDEDPWDDDWRNVVLIELPTGQVSWHIHDSELPMFAWVSPASGRVGIWDGHDTPEKYRRLLAWLATTPGDATVKR